MTEAFGIGTAAVIALVGRLGDENYVETINNNESGPVARHLYEALTDRPSKVVGHAASVRGQMAAPIRGSNGLRLRSDTHLHAPADSDILAEKQKICLMEVWKPWCPESTVLRDKGVLTLPVSLRRKHNLRAGDTFSVIDLGEGAIVLARAPRIDELGDCGCTDGSGGGLYP